MWAAIGGHREVVELLVSKGANVSLVDKYDINILHSACIGGHVEVVKYVLSQNMLDINGRVRCERTPVLLAAENGKKDMVEFLVGKGANLKTLDGKDNNILHCACRGGDIELVKYILSLDMYNIDTEQSGLSAVMIAAKWGHKEVVELLVQLGASLSKIASSKDNILHLPCYRGHLDVMKYLLSLNVWDINKKGWNFRTPVMTAAARGHKEVVELLVKHGAVLTFKERSGNNILYLASNSGNVDLVKYVISLNAVDINSRGWRNKTALMEAGGKGFKAVVELLVNHGADVSLKDEGGKNLRYYARGSREIMAYLKSLRNLKNLR
ncbi:ankyrin repeat domain-containing protein 50-like [Haliotis rubra]|uniref:ankyrin repeat domain-containing protein 50-like n=1 Tax=Haliotis rubra TaxID=36100 RepID=UPI001EE504D1|nr:ankyrin repeat domain-containing protein 50-like [Haliotis rubra]